MLVSKTVHDGMFRLGTLSGVLAVLVFMAGCPFAPQPTPPCTDNAGCDDALYCNGSETCNTETGACDPGTAPCAAGETCNEDTDHCDQCTADADCDDGDDCTDDACTDAECVNTNNTAACDDDDACTENDACADGTCAGTAMDCDDTDACTTDSCADGACVNTDMECTAGETCVDGACVTVCTTDADCDDSDTCTTDACVDGGCSNTAMDCDDTVACTDDSCVDGACVNTDNCTDGETCDTDTGLCAAAAPCTVDADCDDGVFCNGDETCDVDTGECADGTRPCGDADGAGCDDDTATESCSEGDTAAVCTPCPSDTFDFTLNQDNLTGTTGDDLFVAGTQFDSGNFQTLQTGDRANGLAGTDTLSITLVELDTTVVPTLDGIEIWNVTDNSTGTTSINANNVSGVTNINSTNSTHTLVVDGLKTIVDAGVNNSDQGIDLEFASSATSTTSDVMDVTLEQITDSANSNVTLETNNGTNGFETVNITSTGDQDNKLRELIETTGDSIATVAILGSAKLEIVNALDDTLDSLATVDASSSSGGVDLTFGDTLNLTVTGGSGDDAFDFGTTFNSGTSTKDVVDGGDGTGDRLTLILNASQSTAADLTGIEKISIRGDNSAASFSFNFNNVTGIDEIRLESLGAGGTADTLTLNNLDYTTGLALRLRGDGADTNQIFDNLTLDLEGVGTSGVDDPLTINIDNRVSDTPAGIDLETGSRTVMLATLDIDGIENVTINNSDGGDTTITTFNGTDVEELVITSGTDFVVTNALESTNVDKVDCSGCDEDFTINVSNSTQNCTVTGATKENTITTGSGDDEITTGSSEDTIVAGAGDDEITSGGADDTITPGDGSDTVTPGAGDDIIMFSDPGSTAGIDTITMASGDVDGSSIDDIFNFTADDLAGASATLATESDADVTAGTDTAHAAETVIILTADFFADAAAVAAATWDDCGTNGEYMLIYSSSGSADARIALITCNTNDVTAAEDVATLPGLTVAEAATGFAVANFVSD